DKSDAIHALVIDKVIGVATAAAARQGEAMALAETRRRKGRRVEPPSKPAYVVPLTMRYVVPAQEPIVIWDSAVVVTAQPGDTVQDIAQKNTAPAWAIAQINRLNADNPPSPGQRILIPRSIYSAAA